MSIEIDPVTSEFAERNLERMGYGDVLVILGDGALGYPAMAPYDRLALTAACLDFPGPLLAQLKPGGRAIAPMVEDDRQILTLLTKQPGGMRREKLCPVQYVALRGAYVTEALPVEAP